MVKISESIAQMLQKLPLMRCSKCGECKTFGDFRPRHRYGRLYRHTLCRECERKRHRQYRDKNKDRIRVSRSACRKTAKVKTQEQIRRYLSEHPCVDCGEADVEVLEFDHVSGSKLLPITCMVGSGYSWDKIMTEIGKCEVRCANCHRRKTAKELGYYAYIKSYGG